MNDSFVMFYCVGCSNEVCMSEVSYAWVKFYMHEWSSICMSEILYAWVKYTWVKFQTWVVLHLWMSHISNMDKSCSTHKWVMSRIWISHVPHIDESCPTYGWFTSHVSQSGQQHPSMPVSTETASPRKPTKSTSWDSSVQIQIRPKLQFEFVPRNTEESEFLDLVDFRRVAFSVETVMSESCLTS